MNVFNYLEIIKADHLNLTGRFKVSSRLVLKQMAKNLNPDIKSIA